MLPSQSRRERETPFHRETPEEWTSDATQHAPLGWGAMVNIAHLPKF